MILLYIPAVQNFLQRKVTAYVSQTTGMDISIDRVNLRFPLDLVAKNVRIIQAPDTILALESLGLKVKLRPLMSGNIEAHGVFLENVHVNTANMLPTMQLKGTLGRFYLDTRVINLSQQLVDLETAELNDATLLLTMKDTVVVSQDSTETANWKIALPNLEVKNVAFTLNMPADSMEVATYIGDGKIKDILADLGQQLYSVQNISINNTRAIYGQDNIVNISSMSGQFYMDSVKLMVPNLNLQTPYSELNLRAQTLWNSNTPFDINSLEAYFDARLGKQDVLLFAGNMPASFQKDYPEQPLVVQIGAEGNMEKIQISRLTADLPGAFSLKGEGQILNLQDSLNRSADINMQMQTQRLDFLFSMADVAQDGSIVIPPLAANANIKMNGPQLVANLLARESVGTIQLNADYNLNSEAYKANLEIDSLQVNHFMPKDSIYSVSATASVTGRGINFQSTRTTASAKASVNALQYGRYNITGIDLTAELKNALATARLTSNNALLVMDAWGEYKTNSRNLDARASVNIADADLYELRLIDKPMTNTLSLSLAAEAQQDSVNLFLVSGDLEARLRAQGPLQKLINQSMAFSQELAKQIEAQELNHKDLRNSLPTAHLNIKAGQKNPVSRFMLPDNIRFANFRAGFVVNPNRGINGAARIYGLHADTLQLDTVFIVAFQDTARLNLRAGVANGPRNPQYTFKASITGEVRSNDAEVLLDFKNEKGITGLRLGANVKPASNGFQVQLIPENPIVAFREFSFNNHNQVFIRNNGRVLADVQMFNNEGMGLSVQSLPDTTYLQNLDIEVRRIELEDISKLLPYYPSFSGLFSAEATFQQSEENIQLSTEMRIGDLFYERKRAGNIGIGATWLPGNQDKHYIDAYVTLEDIQILTANGSYQGGKQDEFDINTNLEHVPMYFANLFVNEDLIEFAGDLDGNLNLEGSINKPLMNGELILDNVEFYSNPYGLTFRFENRPVKIKNSRLVLDKYGIYTSGNNPFTIDGVVDFSNPSNARADLSLTARNYELINARRRSGRLLYGKAYFDLNSTIKGPLSELVMRGNINVLGTTDINYVLTDSPLTVQDRLGDMVQFVSFADTVSVAQNEPTIALGGLDMIMTINIDQAVKIGVDLTTDRSNYVDLEGGGNLTFQYTPQGDVTLTGRYTLTGGNLKYSLPVIPLKEFSIDEGSYVEWTNNLMNPNLNIRASEKVRVKVPDQGDNNTSQMVFFEPSIVIKNTLENLELEFDVSAPENSDIQAELQAMAPEERSKQAVGIMAAGIYLARGSAGGGLNMSALSNFIQGQLFGFAGDLLNSSNFSIDTDTYNDASGTRTDFNFKYSQRFFNDRVQVIIGGKVSTADTAEQAESFIDNVSLEYRLDNSGTRYVRLYHDRNYENVFEGEIVETGVGLVLRKKVNRLGELFIFKKKK
ncbi:translocation/assembly module TamB [Bacteroides sp. 519]|nr:translocation/assembly module TamB [Bacteroides sp. 519]